MTETHFVSGRVTQSGFRAFDYAASIGRPLNTYVVINLRDTAEQGAITAFTRIRHKFRDWLANLARKRGVSLPPIYIYTFENPRGNVHVNWVVHVPRGLETEFESKLACWVEKTQQGVPGDIHSQPIQAAFAKKLAKYIFKGTDPLCVAHFHLRGEHAPQGKVCGGRRAGISRAIGASARTKAGYRPKRNRPYAPQHIPDLPGGTMVVVRTQHTSEPEWPAEAA